MINFQAVKSTSDTGFLLLRYIGEWYVRNGVGFPLGPTLPNCVQVRGYVQDVLARVTCGVGC